MLFLSGNESRYEELARGIQIDETFVDGEFICFRNRLAIAQNSPPPIMCAPARLDSTKRGGKKLWPVFFSANWALQVSVWFFLFDPFVQPAGRSSVQNPLP